MPDTIAEKLAKLRAQQQQPQGGQSIKERLAALRAQQQPPAQEPEGIVSSFQTGVAGPLLRNVLNTAADLYNRPGETLERAGRSALEFVSAFDPAGNAYEPTVASQEPRLQELRARAAAARPEVLQSMERGLQQQEALPRTRGGRIAGTVGSVLGEAAFPTAPEGAVQNIVLAPFGGAALSTAGKVVAPIARRLALLRSAASGAAQAIEREASPVFAGGLEDVARAMGAAGQEEFTRRSLGLAGQAAEESVAKAAARSPWQDSVLSYYRANLLTNPVGRAGDLGSTIINQFADAAARPIAAAADVIVSKFTGERSITGLSLRGSAEAFGSIPQGFRDVGRVLKTGEQALEGGAGSAYSGEMLSGLGKAVDAPVNGVFRLLGALDAPFRRFGFARNLYDRAKVAAVNEVKSGAITRDQLLARTRELLDDPDIIRAAVRDGEAAVLSEPNKVSSWLAMQTHNSPNARLAIGLVQPFMRIPLNAVLRAADYSGLAGVKAMYKIARGIGRKAGGKSFFRDLEEQRVFSQNIAAGSFAPAAFILGMELEERGRMNGYFYTSKRDFPNGKVPTSVNIAGDNYDVNRLGGYVAAPMLVGATYNRLRKQNADKANALLRSFSGLVQTAPALGYYGVPAQAGRILTSDQPGGEVLKEAGGIASGFIPASGAMGYAAKAIDSEQKRQAEGFTGPILNRIPGLRQRLPVNQGRRRK